jgi:FLVCR family feline leukemia virus subgroup C receptor-related protein
MSKTKNGGEAKDGNQQDYVLYSRRYYMLAIFVAYSMSNAFQWIEFAIIGNVVTDYYGVSRLAVEWTSMIFMVSYIPLIFPAAWFLEKYVSQFHKMYNYFVIFFLVLKKFQRQ